MGVVAQYLSAQEACQRLGVKEATLYAYVSRGLIRSEVESQASRKRRYLAEDVDKLVERKEQRRDPAAETGCGSTGSDAARDPLRAVHGCGVMGVGASAGHAVSEN